MFIPADYTVWSKYCHIWKLILVNRWYNGYLFWVMKKMKYSCDKLYSKIFCILRHDLFAIWDSINLGPIHLPFLFVIKYWPYTDNTKKMYHQFIFSQARLLLKTRIMSEPHECPCDSFDRNLCISEYLTLNSDL